MLKRHIYTSTIANKLLVALCMLLLPLSSFAQVKKMIVEQLVADLADTVKAQEPEKEAHKKKN